LGAIASVEIERRLSRFDLIESLSLLDQIRDAIPNDR